MYFGGMEFEAATLGTDVETCEGYNCLCKNFLGQSEKDASSLS